MELLKARELAEALPLRSGGVVAAACVSSPTETDAALHPKTLPSGSMFEIGSLTKTLTATLLASMVLQGELRLTTTVGELLGHEAGAASEIELRELATHTSGLPRLAPNAITVPFWPRDPYRFYGRKRLVKGLANVMLQERGQMLYSNLGFSLLAACLSAAAGESFNRLLKDVVFDPAGMSSARCQPCSRKRLVRGHGPFLLGGRRWHDPLPGAGGVDCSPEDLARWLQANVFPETSPLEAAVRMCHRAHAQGAKGEVGLAWHMNDELTWHNGATGAFQAFIGFVPSIGGAVTVSNLGLFEQIRHDEVAAKWLRDRLGQAMKSGMTADQEGGTS